jgi:glycosyltransferase involved in cell wall biosynthesis
MPIKKTQSNIVIFHLIDSFGIGGLENGIVNIINGLNKKKYYHVVCSMTNSNESIFKISTTNFSWIGLNKHKADRMMFIKIFRELKRVKPDIVHIRNKGSLIDGFIACKMTGVQNTIYSFHGRNYSEIFNRKKTLKHKIEAKILQKFNVIATLNSFMKEELIEEYDLPSDIVLLPNGVDLLKFKPPSFKEKHTNTRARDLNETDEPTSGHKNKTILIGGVGRLDRIKNYEIIIEACKLLDSEFSNWNFLLAGDGESKKNIQDLISKSKEDLANKIHLIGNKNKICAFFKTIDIFIQPSFYEGFSNTILEAMAMKVPVIASNIGGNATMIRNGFNGLLFDPLDEKELMQCIKKYIQDKPFANKMAENAHKTIKNQYAMDHMVSRYDQLYTKISGR